MTTREINIGYLDQPLTSEANPALSHQSKMFPEGMEKSQHPPEVTTLREWGQLTLPEGKHKGKTFSEAFKDQNYVFQLRNRKGVSQWVKNFQMYGRARVQADYEQSQKLFAQGIPVTVDMLNQMDVGRHQTQVTVKMKSTPVQKDPIESNQWIEVEGVKPSKTEVGKKRTTSPSGSEALTSPMPTEPNVEKIQQLQAQIALLQRELAKETQGFCEAEGQ